MRKRTEKCFYIQYLITTTRTRLSTYVDELTGKHRCLNLQQLPFSWPQTVEIITEDGEGKNAGKAQAVWPLADNLPLSG